MNIIRQKQEGVEFYTITDTGESGMSQSGLAIFKGVSRQALIRLEDALVTKAASKSL